MPEAAISAEALHELIEGRIPSFGQPAVEIELAQLARRCRVLAPAGPALEGEQRLRERFERIARGQQWAWWQGWLGAGISRPLGQRLAAMAIVFGAAGGGASAATGVSPVEFATEAGSFVRSVVVNLAPNGEGPAQPVITPEPSPSATQSTAVPGSATPAPSSAATAEPDPTPDDDDDEDDDRTPEPGDDRSGSNSGSGSGNSGSGSGSDAD